MRTRMRKRICLLIALLPFFWGCRDLLAELAHQGEQVVELAIVVENFVPEAQRTIAPAPLTVGQLGTGYTIKLRGTTGFMDLPERTLTLSNGRTTLGEIPVGLWELTVTVTNNAGVVVLQGKATHQVRQTGGGEVSFLLTPVGLPGTGNLNVTFNLNAQDMAIFNSGGTINRTLTIGVRHLDGSRVAGVTDVGGTQTGQVTLASIPYNARNFPVGEYLMVFQLSGGGIQSGTTVAWQDIVYIEPGRDTVATVTLPQLAVPSPVPTHFSSQVLSDADSFENMFWWDSTYNAKSYELNVRQFTGGSWTNHSETGWNGLTGTTDFSYTVNAWSPNGAPTYKDGSLEGHSTDFTVSISRSAGQHFVARFRSVNEYGKSAWTYLPHLIMPKPTINTLPITKVGQGTNSGKDEFDVTFNITEVNRTRWNITGYRIEWFRLDKVMAHYSCTDQEAFKKVDTDEEWAAELAAGRKMGGEMDYKYTGFAAGRQAGPSMLLWGLNGPSKFCLRIRAYIDGKGYSEWVYWPTLVQAAP